MKLYKFNTFDLLSDDNTSEKPEDGFDSQRAKLRDTFNQRLEQDPQPSPYDIDMPLQRALPLLLDEEVSYRDPIVYFDESVELIIEPIRWTAGNYRGS